MERLLGVPFRWAIGAVLVGVLGVLLHSFLFDKEADAHFKTALLGRLAGQDTSARAVWVAREMERIGDRWRCGTVDLEHWREWRARWGSFVFEAQVSVLSPDKEVAFGALFSAPEGGEVLFGERIGGSQWHWGSLGMDQALLARESVSDFEGFLGLFDSLSAVEEGPSLVRLVGGQAALQGEGVQVRCGLSGNLTQQRWTHVAGGGGARPLSLTAQIRRDQGVIVERKVESVWARAADGARVTVLLTQMVRGGTLEGIKPPLPPRDPGLLGWARVRRLLGDLLAGGLGAAP